MSKKQILRYNFLCLTTVKLAIFFVLWISSAKISKKAPGPSYRTPGSHNPNVKDLRMGGTMELNGINHWVLAKWVAAIFAAA